MAEGVEAEDGGPRPCPVCGGRRLVGGLGFASRSSGYLVAWAMKRKRWWGNVELSDVGGTACLDCGDLRLQITEVEALREHAEAHPEWFDWPLGQRDDPVVDDLAAG